jgi:hypothetical protein
MRFTFMADKAGELLAILKGACDRLEVAGSIRREAGECKDIELVAVPHIAPSPYGGDLFGGSGVAGKIDYTAEKLQELRRRGVLRDRLDRNGHPAWGERAVRALYGEKPPVALDLFIVRPPAQWGMILFIRTGPADYVKAAMSRLHDRGLRCEDGRVVNTAGIVQPTPEETDVFRLLGWDWKDPRERGRAAQRQASALIALPVQESPGSVVPTPDSTHLDEPPLEAMTETQDTGHGTQDSPSCPPHDFTGPLGRADDGYWRPTCCRCGAIRPRSDLL